MRKNLPVSTIEYPFPRGHTLVSTTDTKGRILYCNPMFIEVSGFDKEDLLGQPHNLIRHPDMPEEAFRDMWETIAAGLPWSAPVKNRRKNGDYYWVMANATPLMENGRPMGYMSVRTEASREQIRAAETLYAQMRAEKDAGKRVNTLKAGRLIKATLGGRLRELMRGGLAAKFFIVLLTVLLLGHFLQQLVPQSVPMAGGIALVVELLLTLGAWWYLSRLVVEPVDRLVGCANRIAAGDLTQEIEHNRTDQLGAMEVALSQLNVNLQSIVRDARDQSHEMVNSTHEIALGNQDLSKRTETQAGNLQETASSLEEMTGTVKRTAESSREASVMSAQVSEVAERSSVAVNEVSATMKEIQDASRRISEITQVIDGIAFQTNILALNAAVEAARAGEQGRGFAVVATEVRSLAQRTSTAAKEIAQLIADSAQKVQAGHNKTEAAKATMQDAVDGVRRVNVIINEITNATNEQLAGISQINTSVAQLDSITQQNAGLVEQISASAIELDGLARTVTETVKVFRLDSGPQVQVDAVELRKSMKRPAEPEGNEIPAAPPQRKLALQRAA